MQSQQKRVKWSRGETAEALEERADTGITQASVELMENCIPDIYGNISRRPALKPIPYNVSTYFADYSDFGFSTTRLLDIIPFYISENDFILIGIHELAPAEFIRIKDGVCVYKYVLGFNQGGILGHTGKIYSFAQQNNYLLVAGAAKVVKITLSSLDNGSPYKFVPSVETWEYSAGWYAPNGTQTKVVSANTVTTLNISGQFTNYTYTEPSGLTAVYSYTNTNVPANAKETLKSEIPVGSIIQLPKIGAYFRVEGYTLGSADTTDVNFIDDTFDGVLNPNDAVPSTGKYCQAVNSIAAKGILRKYVNGVQTEQIEVAGGKTQVVKNSASLTGYSSGYFSVGGLHQLFPTTWQGWSDADTSTLKVAMFGELLTPVADSSKTDSSVDVEYGFVSLQPNSFYAGYDGIRVIYPHPEQLCFCDQRLWVANWQISSSVNSEKYPVVIGSQVARYNDFKNNYNDENEPITLDVLTNFKEKILHLVDYNGLKIMTDCYEYAYEDGGIIKQSGNGSWEDCEPLVFDSLCLYVDSTGHQIKAMQYEFQSNIFNSSTINQLTPHDLIWKPIGMGFYEDKIHSTGKYLFVVNKDGASAKLAVCNFVPSNQANIWSRWAFPNYNNYTNMLYNVVRMKDKTLFMVFAKSVINNNTDRTVIIPAVLDFDANADFEANVVDNYYTIALHNTERLTLSGTVNIYSNGIFQFATTAHYYGYVSADISQLTNVTVGMPINATIRSHPIDVGGKTKSIKKRIAKARMSVRDTEPGALTINGKTGYMNPAEDYISFYGVTGMKQEIKYTITNNNGAMFHLESLLMNIEYGTLIS